MLIDPEEGGILLKYPRIEIKEVIPDSIAEDAGIEKGDVLLSINGEKIRDIFDYRYHMANENLVVE
ncbi:MAG TPA: PDZ domain-containing protein, partial [Clostridia bacterium]